MFKARATFQPGVAQVQRLQREEADLVGFILGQEFFFAFDLKAAREELRAERAVPSAALGLHEFQPAFHRLVVEGRADLTRILDFLMLIIGITCAQADAVEEAAIDGDFAAQVDAVLLHAQPHLLRLAIGGECIAHRHTVEIVGMRERHAQIAAIVDIGRAAGHFPYAPGAVGQLAFEVRKVGNLRVAARRRLRAQRRRQNIVASVEIAGLAVAAVQMDDELVGQRHFDFARARALIGGAAIGADRVDMYRLIGHAARNAAVDHIDDAADRRRPIEQGGRPAQDFDAIGGQRIDRHGMVDRCVRHVEAADPIGQDAHALALETAQDGARCAGAKGGRRHARLTRQRFADAGAQFAGEFLTGQDAGARQYVPLPPRDQGGDDNVGALVMIAAILIRVGGRRGLGKARDGKAQQRQGAAGAQHRKAGHGGSTL